MKEHDLIWKFWASEQMAKEIKVRTIFTFEDELSLRQILGKVE